MIWKLNEGGTVATGIGEGNKVTYRIILDNQGVRWHRYDEKFKHIACGRTVSIKEGMEKFNV